jgi:hypothetical protein
MEEMSLEYWNQLANQMMMISSLLGGFSIAVVANLLVSETNTRLFRSIMKTAVLAASFFLISVFAMTEILMMTTNGYPLQMTKGELTTPATIGGLTLLFGIISLTVLIALAGWTKSKELGKFTTITGIITLLLILYMLA